MIKKVFRQGLAAALLGAAALTPALATELRGIGLSSVGDSAQLTLDLSDAAKQSLFTLDHPDRVVIDLPHTARMHGVHAPPPAGVVTAVRFGSQPHGTLRVVIELRNSLPVHSNWGTGTGGRELTVTLGQPTVALAAATGPKAVRAVHAPLGDGDRDVI